MFCNMSLVIPSTKYKELHFTGKLFKQIHVTEQQYIFIYKKGEVFPLHARLSPRGWVEV